MSESKHRTITLTDRAPVRIRQDLWPIVAAASEHDGKVESQAVRTWTLRVRQHADGRAIVYGVYRSNWEGARGAAGGELCEAGADLAAAIHRVAATCECEAIAGECIADLPPVDLDGAGDLSEQCPEHGCAKWRCQTSHDTTDDVDGAVAS